MARANQRGAGAHRERTSAEAGADRVAPHGGPVSPAPATVPRRSSRATLGDLCADHRHAVLACDSFTAITARSRILYVFVVLDVGTRRIVHWNVTEHPTADWTIQQCRTAITGETPHRFLIHDRDAIYAPAVDRAIRSMGLRVLKTPMRTPQANAFCERVIGTIRRECLDWLIPVHERHLCGILRAWVTHYNQGRPHASLGPGMPEPPPTQIRPEPTGHHLPRAVG